MRRHLGKLLFLLVCLPAGAGAQPLYETDFDDLQGWTSSWPADAWRISRGQVQPVTDSTCAEAGEVGCAFGAPVEAIDNVLHAGDTTWTDYRVTASFTNYDDDAVGFVFRHQDPDNYYLFLTSRGVWPSAARPSTDESGVTARLYRVQNGRSALLASADVSYTQQTSHLVRVDAVGNELAVFLDLDGDGLLPSSERVFFVADESPIRRGDVGLWAYDNRNVFVDWLRVFEIVPPPRPSNVRVTSIDRAGEVARFAFDLATAATGYLMTAEGRCAEVDPALRQPDAGVGTRIVGGLSTKVDTDYCMVACATNVNGTACGQEIDFSTRGAVIDTTHLSPGHWDLSTVDDTELLRSRPTGAVHATAARLGAYRLRVHGKALTFQVDQSGNAALGADTLDGRATVSGGRLVIRGLPITIDMARQPADARWAVLGAEYDVNLGAFEGRGAQALEVLPGDYLARVRGRDVRFSVGDDGAIIVPAGEPATAAGSTLTPTGITDGDAVAFRFTVRNEGPNAVRGAGLLNGRGARPGDDTGVVFNAIHDYVLADATRPLFGNLATSLGFQPGPHAFYAFDRVDSGGNATFDVLIFPSNADLEFIGDVAGTLDRFVVLAAPHRITVFDAADDPTEGSARLTEVDVNGGTRRPIRHRFAAATDVDYGRLTWEILARSATPGALLIHNMNADGTKVRVAFGANRPGTGSVQYVVGGCADAQWSAAREVSFGGGVEYAGDLVTQAEQTYCARPRVRNEAGARFGAGVSFSTRQISIDGTALRGRYRLQRPGANETTLVDAGAARGDLGLRMGTYLVDQGGDELPLTVDKDGHVTYAPDLQGIFDGAGTDTLVLAGVRLRLDLSELTGEGPVSAGIGDASDLGLGALAGGQVADWRVLPGDFALEHGERHGFVVQRDGAVVSRSAAALAGGPNALVARGRAVRFDLLPLPGQATIGAAKGQPTHFAMEGGRVNAAKLLPGRYTLGVDGTRSVFRVSDAVAPSFGAIDALLPFRSCAGQGAQVEAEGIGTDLMVLRAAPCSITAEMECTEECGEEINVFQLTTGRGVARGVVRYASGQPLRGDEVVNVTLEVDGGSLSAAAANTVDGAASADYTAPNRRGDYLLRVTAGALTATRPFVVIPIRDFSPPRIEPGPPVMVEQTNADGAPLRLEAPRVTDNVDPAPRVTSDAPETFPLGRSVVTWRAVDFNGNAAFANQVVTVVDTTPPTVHAPARIDVEATSPAGTLIDERTASAEDICDARPSLTRSGPRGFAVGELMVTWTATDDSGNRATTDTLVTVVDTTPPVIVFDRQEIVVEATNARGALGIDLPLPVVTDNGDPNPRVTHSAPGSLPRGRTQVTFTATDASGNQSTARIAVLVVDGTPPRIDVTNAPTGWLQRATFAVSLFDVGDEQPALDINPAPDAEEPTLDGVRVTYLTGGVYDVQLRALDDDGNTAQRVLRTFGVDPDPPRLRLATSLPAEADPDDPATWSIVFTRERIRLAVDASDAPANGVSGLASLRVVLDPDGDDAMVLVEQAPVPAGAPLAVGPNALRGVRCTDALLCTVDGDLIAARAGAGTHVVSIEAADVAGNVTVIRRYFRVFTLQAALLEARDQVDDLAAAAGVANEGQDALNEAAGYLEEAAALAVGQPAGVAAPLDLTGGVLRKLQRVAPALRRAGRFGVDAAAVESLVGRAIYWAVAGYGEVGLDPDVGDQGDYDRALEVFLPDAQLQLDQGNLDQALASLVDAYFLFGNALRPFRADSFAQSSQTIGRVRDQVQAYLAVPGRPGADVLGGLAADLAEVARDVEGFAAIVGDAATDEELLVALAAVPADDYLATLLQLQRAARAMQSAGQDDVWIRNWGWGLIQSVMFLADKAFQRAAFVLINGMVPEANTLVPRAEAKVDEGQALVADRQIDRFIQLFLARDTECVIVLMYRAAFDDNYAVPAYCEE